jgi:AmmeMemoRadiSam system protein A
VTPEDAILLRLAREAIQASLGGADVTVPADAWLQTPAAVFVTVRQRADGALRGCVGSMEAHQPLGLAVVAAARAAALHDTRFVPLSPAELPWVRLEISVLSPLVPLPVADELDACRQIERTRPGVVLTLGRRRSVLLPKVWDAIEGAAEFLQHLKIKAGLAPAFWSASIQLHVFTSDDCGEPDERIAAAEAR